jgi:signal transduction histidine kinase
MRAIAIEWDGIPSFLISVRDISRRKFAEEELRRYSETLEQTVADRTHELREAQDSLLRSEKLSVLGQMAGSVGHELRTPLSTISNAAYYLNMVLGKPEEQIAEYLDIIRSQTRRAEKIIADLLDFARVKALNRQEVQLADVVELVLEKHAPPDAIQVAIDIPDDLPDVVADPLHIDQVLSNLVMNAYQAMPQGGTLTVGSTHVAGGSRQSAVNGRLHEGSSLPTAPCVLLTVQDSGSGIAPENIEKLFEPLFTTKSKGIGLGLAVCKNLVEANGGSIEVQSTPGQGSMFRVTLPAAQEHKY